MDQEVAKAVARLEIDHAATVRLMKAYSHATFHYRFAQVEKLGAVTIAEWVAVLNDIASHMKNAALELTAMPPSYSEALARSINNYARLGRDMPPADHFLAIAAGIDDLTDLLRAPSNRPTHTALERSMRTLLPAIEEATGSRASIRWNKVKGGEPESGSPITDALVAMLRSLDGRLRDKTIFNMIEKVRKRPEPPVPFVS